MICMWLVFVADITRALIGYFSSMNAQTPITGLQKLNKKLYVN